jgi:hypothetical protein
VAKKAKPQDILNPTGAPVLVRYVVAGEERTYKVRGKGVSYEQLVQEGIDVNAFLNSTHLASLCNRSTLSRRPAAVTPPVPAAGAPAAAAPAAPAKAARAAASKPEA